MKGILGIKLGMTEVFEKNGNLIPVTVVKVEPNVVTQIKTKENDGYEAIQLGFDTKRAKLSNKALDGHVKKANTEPKRYFREFRNVNINNYELGQEVTVELFEQGEIVDVTATSKGKGFAGAIKRHNQNRGPMGHGSHFHRRPGSLGNMRLKRVQKGHNLPGHMGATVVTIQNLEVVVVDPENNILLIKGNVPGPKKSLVLIKSAVKGLKKKVEGREFTNYAEVIKEELANEDVEEQVVDEVTEEIVEEAVAEEGIEEINEEPVAEEAAEEIKEEA